MDDFASLEYDVPMISPRTWTESEIQELRRKWKAGIAVSRIAASLGRSKGSCNVKATRLGLPPRSGASGATVMRPCMMCGRQFESYGKFNRICVTCKESDEWKSDDYRVITY